MISQWSSLSKEMIEDMNRIRLNTFDIRILKHISRKLPYTEHNPVTD